MLITYRVLQVMAYFFLNDESFLFTIKSYLRFYSQYISILLVLRFDAPSPPGVSSTKPSDFINLFKFLEPQTVEIKYWIVTLPLPFVKFRYRKRAACSDYTPNKETPVGVAVVDPKSRIYAWGENQFEGMYFKHSLFKHLNT